MKSFSEINKSKTKVHLDVQANSIIYLTVDQLKKYLEVVKSFISDETKNIIQWLIVNNSTYLADLAMDDSNSSSEENVLAAFYNIGKPKNSEERELYQWLKTVVEDDKSLEVPVFLTREQFDQIINRSIAPDRIFLQLDTEEGRSKTAKRFEPLVHKICKQWLGKINLDYEELLSVAWEGFVYGMNSYGKKNKRSKADDQNVLQMRFMQYVAWTMRNCILDIGVKDSHTISISKNSLKKEREEMGYNVKSHTLSGDKTISKSDDKGSKTIFDFIDTGENISNNIDYEELDKLWQEVFALLEKNFDKKIMYIWYSFYELNGHKKVSNKELAKKFGMVNSSITYYIYKVNNFIQHNKQIKAKFTDIYELTKECLHDEQDRNSDIIPINLKSVLPNVVE